MIEIFYWYNVDLKDDSSLNFEDILEKAFVLVKRNKCLANFMQNIEKDLTNQHINFEENHFNDLNTVESFTLSE